MQNNLSLLTRRDFVHSAAAGLGLLVCGGPTLATFNRRPTYLPQAVPQVQLPVAAQDPLAFEVGSGVNPHLMVRVVQDYIAVTLSPEWAARVVQAQAVARNATSLHQQFASNYNLAMPLPPTRTRFGYYVSIDAVLRADAQVGIRPMLDLNFYEVRRLIHPAEVAQFGLVLSPASYRQAPTPIDLENFQRVARTAYGIPNPETLTVLYTRLFSNGRDAFVGFLVAHGPDPLRTPYKDVLLDTVPVR